MIGGSPIGLLLALTYAVSSDTGWTEVGEDPTAWTEQGTTGTSWTEQ